MSTLARHITSVANAGENLHCMAVRTYQMSKIEGIPALDKTRLQVRALKTELRSHACFKELDALRVQMYRDSCGYRLLP